jgi:hypothetical protein
MSNFIGLCKDEIFVYLKSTVKQTIVEYISQLDDDSNPNQDDENNQNHVCNWVDLQKTFYDNPLHIEWTRDV